MQTYRARPIDATKILTRRELVAVSRAKSFNEGELAEQRDRLCRHHRSWPLARRT